MLLRVEPLGASHSVDTPRASVWKRAGAAVLLVLLAGLLVKAAVGSWHGDNNPCTSQVVGCLYQGSIQRVPHYPDSTSDLPEVVLKGLRRRSLRQHKQVVRPKPEHLYIMVACAGTTCGVAFRAIRSEAIRTQSTTQQVVDGHDGEVHSGPGAPLTPTTSIPAAPPPSPPIRKSAGGANPSTLERERAPVSRESLLITRPA